MKIYLKTYAFGNAVQDNLWESLDNATDEATLGPNLTVKQIMDTWTTQKGYPVVKVTRVNNELSLTQNWFLLNPLNKVQNTSEYAKYRWYIPFTYTTKKESDFSFESKTHWFRKEEDKCKLILGFSLVNYFK